MGPERISMARRLAAKLLQALLRHAPEHRRAWLEAMLHELDWVEGDLAAFFWALGCTGVVFRECLRAGASWLGRQCANLLGFQTDKEGKKMNATGKKTLGVLAGIGLALVLGISVFFLAPSIGLALESIGIHRNMWTHVLTVILPTELIAVAIAVFLWRKRQAPVAIGILATALLMAGHVVVTLAMR
jgi:hypothetical protein